MLAWLRRARARRRLGEDLGLWYHSGYSPEALCRSMRGVDLNRGELVIAALARHELLESGDVRAAPLASYQELARFHSPAYLNESAQPEVLGRVFGLDPAEIEPDELLHSARLAVGGTLAAARACTLGNPRLRVGVNLGGGFHHAEPDKGGGFCVYNDVGVAIQVLRHLGFTGRVAIIDLDFHQGNGNQLGFSTDESVFTYSLQGAVWSHFDPPIGREITLPAGTEDQDYLAVLKDSLGPELVRFAPALVFYVAGTDVLAGDRLGTFRLTPAGVLARDRQVLEAVRAVDARLVVTLGGGYSAGAWKATAAFLRCLLTDEARPYEERSPSLRSHFRRVAAELDPARLAGGDDVWSLEITERDVLEGLSGRPGARRLLDYYSTQGVEYALEAYGIAGKVRARGYPALEYVVDPGDPEHQMVRVFGQHESGRRHLLVELVMAIRPMELPLAEPGEPPARVLAVEWLLLQDPEAHFTLDRPQLPAQKHPGLGIAEEIQELLVQSCHRLALDGLWDRPAHFHNALLASGHFRFVAAEDEGRFRAIAKVLSGLGLAEAQQALQRQALCLEDGTTVGYEPKDHVLPTSERLRAYFGSEAYKKAAEEEEERVLAAGLHYRRA